MIRVTLSLSRVGCITGFIKRFFLTGLGRLCDWHTIWLSPCCCCMAGCAIGILYGCLQVAAVCRLCDWHAIRLSPGCCCMVGCMIGISYGCIQVAAVWQAVLLAYHAVVSRLLLYGRLYDWHTVRLSSGSSCMAGCVIGMPHGCLQVAAVW